MFWGPSAPIFLGMNRREFGKSLAVTAAVPLLPLPAAAAPVAVKPIDLMWAKAIARAQNGVTPGYLAKALNVSADVAHVLQRQLIKDNVIRAGATRGATIATKPLFPKGGYQKVGPTLLDKMQQVARDQAQSMVNPTPPRPSDRPVSHQDQTDHHNHASSEPHPPDCTH